MVLAGNSANNERTRYTLETLLSTLGLTFEFTTSLSEMDARAPRRNVYLMVGDPRDGLMDLIARETAVVVLPEPDLDVPLGAIVSQPTQRGHLIGIAGDIIGAAFGLLARHEEYIVPARDEHDRFRWEHSPLSSSGSAARPLVSQHALLLLSCLQDACSQAGLPTVRKEFWPLGKPVAACLSHDVDVVRRGKLPRGVAVRDLARTLSSLGRGQLGKAAYQISTIARTACSGQDPYWTFDLISAMEKKRGYRSTYFFMAERLHSEDAGYDLRQPRMARLLEELAVQGCEIGLHGSYATYADSASLRRQRALLEERFGQQVPGHRNHLLRFRVPESWRAQDSAGFSYDSTLGFADHEGFRGGSAFPFRPYDLANDRQLGILEIPLAVMDVSLRKYRRLRGDAAEQAVAACLEEALAVHGLATLLWHNHSFYEPDSPGCSHLYEMAMDWLAEKDAYVAPCREIDRWWRAREAVRITPLAADRTGWMLQSPYEIEGLVLRVSLPYPRSLLRLHGQVPMALRRDGSDHLLEFGRLPAGSSVDIEYS